MITIRNVSKWYGNFQVLTNCSDRGRQRRGGGGVRPVGLRQVDADQVRQRARAVPERRRSPSTAISVGDPKTDLPKLRARIGMVFQHFELFPHLSVTDNLTLAQVKVLGREPKAAAEKGHEAARARRA